MVRRVQFACVSVAMFVALGTLVSTQNIESRKLGPDTAKSIAEAKLDPTFQTTKLDRVAVLPFANTPQYKEAASVISKNLVVQLSQLHSDYKFVSPEEIINFVSNAGLNDDYNVFLGDYLGSGTARTDFLTGLRTKLQIDAVFVGQITHWGEVPTISTFLGKAIRTKSWVAGMEMSLYRTTDGRRIWYGKDLINAGKQDRMHDAASALSEVFSRFFGRAAF